MEWIEVPNLTGKQPQPKAPREPRDMAYLEKVKRLPCCVCGAAPPSDAHHTISGRHGTRKRPDSMAIPLCKEHHQDGPLAIHRGKQTWEKRYGPDTDYIEQTQKLVEAMT